MTIEEATFLLLKQLRTVYSAEEAGQMTDWVMEAITGSRKAERMIYKKQPLTSAEAQLVEQHLQRLLQHEPVQYVLQEAWFYGMKFYTSPAVLIPRPETEELVDWIIKDHDPSKNINILDIGTGSGCIAISLQKKLPQAAVSALDISEEALEIARKNADTLRATIHFQQFDFLDESSWGNTGQYAIIVSNPPYIPQAEKQNMSDNVVKYEPHTALFVPDDNALLFYDAIARFGQAHLYQDGNIYTEIHEDLGKQVTALFTAYGYQVQLKKDMQGKDRMVKAWRL